MVEASTSSSWSPRLPVDVLVDIADNLVHLGLFATLRSLFNTGRLARNNLQAQAYHTMVFKFAEEQKTGRKWGKFVASGNARYVRYLMVDHDEQGEEMFSHLLAEDLGRVVSCLGWGQHGTSLAHGGR
ncbi:hypothetical protein QFC20_006138 [Naganishia adeliensis]|uniref:Uncharacterized protein n=1 Tax=Naganishia adeliensis TaxID=92952 RepID=A0ACC2VEU1_9TREE|nr:hypothetical protein QFC20_006138 [Naganishia adeliensis]